MSLSIRTNVASLNAQRNLTATQNTLGSSLSRLSSGFRISKAGDDAAGLGISTKLESQIRSYNQATRNANDGLSVVQATESALNEQASILTRLRELAMQSASDGIGNTERSYVDKEAQALVSELERIAQVTEYNGTKLLDGTNASGLDFQVGIANSTNDVISLETLNATTAAPAAAGAAGPATAIAAPFSVDALTTTAQLGIIASMNAGTDVGGAINAVRTDLGLSGVPGTYALSFAIAAGQIFNVGFQAAGGIPGGEAYVGTPNAAQQAGLDLLAATQNGGVGAGFGSAELAAAYSAYGTALVTSGGDLAAAGAAITLAHGSAGLVVGNLFRSNYAAAYGFAPPAFTVPLGTGPATTALAALGLAYVPGAPGAAANAGGLNLASLSMASKSGALAALASIDAALGMISSNRATVGATGNRLQSAVNNIQSFSESLSAANSRIKDVDVAEETSRMSRAQILSQAGVSVLAQANQMPQLALKLLG